MTQAFNLSQLANKVNTSGQLDVATGVTGTQAVANGGTGQSTYTDGQLLIGNTTGNTLTKATITAGSGITVTNGSGAITIAASATGGGFSNMQVFTAPGTFTTPASTTRMKISVVGGGGGGTDGTFQPVFPSPTLYPGGGGGGGGSAIYVGAVTANTPYPITVGTAGINGPNGSPNPYASPNSTPGNSSSFGSLVSATGGNGGTFANAGGAGGTGTGGNLNLTGVKGYKAVNQVPTVTVPAIGGGSGLGVSYGLGGGQATPLGGVVIVEW
jgi:hypothetical protein